jgi:GMP synthase (glutamine-hydrolysing)
VETYLRSIREEVTDRVGDKKVLLLTSGGVDSTVVAAVLLDTLSADQVYLMYINSGLMRKNESAEVAELLGRLGARHLHIIDASDRFLNALVGVSDPEEKRRIIGDMFISVQEQEIHRFGIKHSFLAQGTLYTDMIESGKGVGKKADVIKSHHNVRSPLVEEKRANGLLLEPLAGLYKDEVRHLGERLGLSRETVWRHPFPGPGLAVRILGKVTREKVRILQNADAIYMEELKQRDLYDKIWQAFSVMLPLRSVGVAGDLRRYGYVLALRAVVSRDGMTADVYPFPSLDLLEISSRITNEVPEIGRVVYDVSSKPPATIEWE